MIQPHLRAARLILLVFCAAALSTGCTTRSDPEADSSSRLSDRATLAGRSFLAMKVTGLQSGNGAVYLVRGDVGGERAELVSRCRSVEIDRVHPEGLLLPVHCDGQRITVHNKAGQLVLRREEAAKLR